MCTQTAWSRPVLLHLLQFPPSPKVTCLSEEKFQQGSERTHKPVQPRPGSPRVFSELSLSQSKHYRAPWPAAGETAREVGVEAVTCGAEAFSELLRLELPC